MAYTKYSFTRRISTRLLATRHIALFLRQSNFLFRNKEKSIHKTFETVIHQHRFCPYSDALAQREGMTSRDQELTFRSYQMVPSF